MLAVGMDMHLVEILRSQQMHGISNHHGALVEMAFVIPLALPDAVGWRCGEPYEVVEAHAALRLFRWHITDYETTSEAVPPSSSFRRPRLWQIENVGKRRTVGRGILPFLYMFEAG